MPWGALFVATVSIALAIPVILKKVPRNWLYGFRTPKTLASDRVWYEANRIAGWGLLTVGVVTLIVVGLRAVVPALETKPPAFFVLQVFMPALLVALLHSFWRLRAL